MDEFIKELDANLDYLGHEITADEVIIYVVSNRRSCAERFDFLKQNVKKDIERRGRGRGEKHHLQPL